jgi:hypothetical protein
MTIPYRGHAIDAAAEDTQDKPLCQYCGFVLMPTDKGFICWGTSCHDSRPKQSESRSIMYDLDLLEDGITQENPLQAEVERLKLEVAHWQNECARFQGDVARWKEDAEQWRHVVATSEQLMKEQPTHEPEYR